MSDRPEVRDGWVTVAGSPGYTWSRAWWPEGQRRTYTGYIIEYRTSPGVYHITTDTDINTAVVSDIPTLEAAKAIFLMRRGA